MRYVLLLYAVSTVVPSTRSMKAFLKSRSSRRVRAMMSYMVSIRITLCVISAQTKMSSSCCRIDVEYPGHNSNWNSGTAVCANVDWKLLILFLQSSNDGKCYLPWHPRRRNFDQRVVDEANPCFDGGSNCVKWKENVWIFRKTLGRIANGQWANGSYRTHFKIWSDVDSDIDTSPVNLMTRMYVSLSIRPVTDFSTTSLSSFRVRNSCVPSNK